MPAHDRPELGGQGAEQEVRPTTELEAESVGLGVCARSLVAATIGAAKPQVELGKLVLLRQLDRRAEMSAGLEVGRRGTRELGGSGQPLHRPRLDLGLDRQPDLLAKRDRLAVVVGNQLGDGLGIIRARLQPRGRGRVQRGSLAACEGRVRDFPDQDVPEGEGVLPHGPEQVAIAQRTQARLRLVMEARIERQDAGLPK